MITMVIYEARDVADRTLRVRHNRVGSDEVFLLEIETTYGTQTAALSVSEGLALGRTLVHRATACRLRSSPGRTSRRR